MKSLARQISVLLLLAFCAAGALQAQAAVDRNTLHAEIRQDGARLSVHADLDGQSKTFVLPAQVIKDLKQLYDDLEARRGRDFAAVGKRLGDLVLSPLGPMLKRAKVVLFTITEDLIGLPLDLLAFAGTSYFLAPILSNEAGNSSTRTIRLFFKNLAETGSPAESLYLTRRQLYQEFQKDPPAKRLWRAYPFRLYRLS